MGINAKFEIDEESLKEGFREVLLAQFSPEKQSAMIEAAIAHVLNGKDRFTDEPTLDRIIRRAVEDHVDRIVKEYFEDPVRKEDLKSSVFKAIETFRYETKGKKLMEMVIDFLSENMRL